MNNAFPEIIEHRGGKIDREQDFGYTAEYGFNGSGHFNRVRDLVVGRLQTSVARDGVVSVAAVMSSNCITVAFTSSR
ncbi:hypothetical protein PsorP6_015102 [Peronosclerospora sorghi]|uniref:Uncharacterized protein n=1 Tax=Peronosclerospora sorghi TaxID=230839 RepID=A0ACC0VW38_9STRA|nr:hypothetical protein PsorP6_015102 [Peronosclerospora sorghi]